ncbi:hypothetical protein [Streptomyces sp. bgisy153]|uniref:hypothetical protein n=1 Tax=Streptomyces sp. bgisy153 TaxID=3413793 RepID=UPI003D72E870
MRRTVRVLAVAALGGAVLGVAPAAYAEPAAEVTPGSVAPGGTVTVSVTCDPLGGPAPATLDATSQAFAEGTVALQKASGADDELSGPEYRGTARIADAAHFEGVDGTGPDTAWTVDGTCPAPPGGKGQPWSVTFDVTRTAPAPSPCPSPHGTPPPGPTCGKAPVQRGVHAGQGGAFTDSVPALVAGGVLIAGALGAAVHRLRRRDGSVRA